MVSSQEDAVKRVRLLMDEVDESVSIRTPYVAYAESTVGRQSR